MTMIVLKGRAAKVAAEIEAKEKELEIEPRELNESEQVTLFLIMRAFQMDDRYADMISTFTDLYALIQQKGTSNDMARLHMLVDASRMAFDAKLNKK